LQLLERVDSNAPEIYTKSGLMLGFGETREEVIKTLEDLRDVHCQMLTMGQYLQPSKHHLPVVRFVPPEEFDAYRKIALSMGFDQVASGPLVRSSYQAENLYHCLG
jgi:lipoic acid synthetase